MNVGIGTEAAQFLFQEYTNSIFGTVYVAIQIKQGWRSIVNPCRRSASHIALVGLVLRFGLVCYSSNIGGKNTKLN
jgi:hypothetical protein